ncbi:uncharacterized protein LOC125493699 [Beta vulgaris subsp. vulgaris]|uniref:uncharacterized protein LOC125493699 n=1 Tax=Beta vulgaris subsp. vulgaris TaxID=3555 RepID=UPI0020367717|nr:uncharacterized protein LOC125493699 [Beta vulgaris subsp. vulgaris]
MTTLYEDVDPVSFLAKSGVEVTSWAVEPSSNPDPNRRVDEFFTVQIYYHDTYINVDKSGSFRLERTSPYNRPKVQADVLQWLLEFDVDGEAHGCAIDVVDDTCETFLEEISTLDRKSFAMVVQINVGPEYEYDEDMDMTNTGMDPQEPIDTDEEKKACAKEVETYLRTNKIIRPTKVDTGCSCSICFEEFDKSYNSGEQEVASLACSHIFHGSCLVSWILEKKSTCPLCRSDFIMSC